MKKIFTLTIAIVLVNFSLKAQFTCNAAQTITPGTHSVGVIAGGQIPPIPNCADNYGSATGARWYMYQASVDGLATVSSNLPANNNADTRLLVFTGTCSALVCHEGNDDIDGPTIKTSEVSFSVSNGTNYYISWDNTYNPPAFDFTLTETAVSCPSETFPINEDFDNFNSFVACLTTETVDANNTDFEQSFFDWDGDGNDEDYVTNGSTSTIAKDDWLFSTPVNLITGNEYTINFKYNGANGTFNANENLDVYFIDSPSASGTVLTNLFSDTGITRNGAIQEAETMAFSQSVTYTSTVTGTYYLAFNGSSAANTGSLLLFDYSISEQSLGVENPSNSSIRIIFNSETDILTLTSTYLAFSKLEVYNILGQTVFNKELTSQNENITLSELVDGIYVIKAYSNDKVKTIKVLKQ